jgi:hypothetical protein
MAEIKKRVRLARCGTASPTHAGGENRHQSCRSSTKWTMRRRLPYWYDQLKVLEVSINANPSDNHLIERLFEIEGIQDAVSRIRFPLAFTDQLYNLRSHIDIVRHRLAPRASPPLRMAAE